MTTLDYVVVCSFFLVLVGIGFTAFRKVKGSKDFFVGGGNVPWWLAGVSHHVSGYSGAVFVAYAVVAYRYGFTLYVWWAVSLALSCLAGAFLIAPRWSRLRIRLDIESPTEYLSTRYNVATQQLMAWSGVLIKLFDIGAKWASLGFLLHGFTGLPITTGILVAGAVSLLYITVGGLWADLYTDLMQFVIQIVAGVVMLVATARYLGGAGSLLGIWSQLPEGHTSLFNGPFTPAFFVGFLAAAFYSYNGGTWNLAARYIATPSGASARRSALLSSLLYAVWPLVLFFPMWAAPIVFPGMNDPSSLYPDLTRKFLPAGLMGLVVASMFATTMSMTTSDTNTISSVFTRDILPFVSRRFRNLGQRRSLLVARLCTLGFTIVTLTIAVEHDRFGGIIGLLLTWFGGLIGPVSVPMILGLLPAFRHAGPGTAISSILAGFTAFIVATLGFPDSQAIRIAAPVFTSTIVFFAMTYLMRKRPIPARVTELMSALGGAGGARPS